LLDSLLQEKTMRLRRILVSQYICLLYCIYGQINAGRDSSSEEDGRSVENECGRGWVNLKDRCYHFGIEVNSNWTMAADYCRKKCSNLVIIDTQQELNEIDNHIIESGIMDKFAPNWKGIRHLVFWCEHNRRPGYKTSDSKKLSLLNTDEQALTLHFEDAKCSVLAMENMILRPRITSCDLRVIFFQKKIIIINKKVKGTKIVSIPVRR